MSSYKFSVEHQCNLAVVVEILQHFGFKDEGEGTFTMMINDWRPLTLKIVKKANLELIPYWAGKDTSEVYFDYLLKCGYVVGQLSIYLDGASQGHFRKPRKKQ